MEEEELNSNPALGVEDLNEMFVIQDLGVPDLRDFLPEDIVRSDSTRASSGDVEFSRPDGLRTLCGDIAFSRPDGLRTIPGDFGSSRPDGLRTLCGDIAFSRPDGLRTIPGDFGSSRPDGLRTIPEIGRASCRERV